MLGSSCPAQVPAWLTKASRRPPPHTSWPSLPPMPSSWCPLQFVPRAIPRPRPLRLQKTARNRWARHDDKWELISPVPRAQGTELRGPQPALTLRQMGADSGLWCLPAQGQVLALCLCCVTWASFLTSLCLVFICERGEIRVSLML